MTRMRSILQTVCVCVYIHARSRPWGCFKKHNGPSNWATDHCLMLFVQSRMVLHLIGRSVVFIETAPCSCINHVVRAQLTFQEWAQPCQLLDCCRGVVLVSARLSSARDCASGRPLLCQAVYFGKVAVVEGVG